MLRKFLKCNAGTANIEYGLIVLLIAASIVGAVGNFGEENTVTYDDISEKVILAVD